MDRTVGNHAKADVLVEDGLITEVGPEIRARDAETIDATDTIVMPGFVDTHRHAWKTLFRNMGRGGAGGSPVGPAIYGPHYGPDDVYAATLVALLGAAEAGITTVVDWSDVQMDRAITAAALRAHADSGVRTVFVPASPTWIGDGANQTPVHGELVSADVHPNTSLAFGPPDPSRHDLERAVSGWGDARGRGLRIHAHVGRDVSERGLVAELAGRGLLARDVTLVHCTNLDEADLDAVASSGAMVSLTPSTEMGAGYGAPPLQAFIDRGIRPGLGVGDEVEAPGDLFAQMRAANSIQHATLFDLKLAGKAGIPHLLSTREVIRYGTIDGARAAGLDAITGSLAPGKQADILVLRADRPNIAPINDPIGAVVWEWTPPTSSGCWSGRDSGQGEELTADTAWVRQLAMAAQRRVASAPGLLAVAGESS
jgi:cytosine/adenosine deaminase-related metal-dependent hydrolase